MSASLTLAYSGEREPDFQHTSPPTLRHVASITFCHNQVKSMHITAMNSNRLYLPLRLLSSCCFGKDIRFGL